MSHRREVERAIRTALAAEGYRRSPGAPAMLVKPIADELLGWVVAGVHSVGGHIEASPNVGVRYTPLHALLDGVRDQPRPGEPTTTSMLGYLMPQHTANLVWRFDDQPIWAQAAALVAAVVRYGEPWMTELASIDALIDRLRRHQRGAAPPTPERLPAALLVAGRVAQARAALDAELAKLGNRTDAAAGSFRALAQRLAPLIDAADA